MYQSLYCYDGPLLCGFNVAIKGLNQYYGKTVTAVVIKLCKLVASEVHISGQNSKFWQFWGLYSHIFAPINVKVDTKERTCGPLPRANFHVCRGNVSPLWGENPIFGPVSKNNTGMAALHAGLPVKILVVVQITRVSRTTFWFVDTHTDRQTDRQTVWDRHDENNTSWLVTR